MDTICRAHGILASHSHEIYTTMLVIEQRSYHIANGVNKGFPQMEVSLVFQYPCHFDIHLSLAGLVSTEKTPF
jgi:hypothetical protein